MKKMRKCCDTPRGRKKKHKEDCPFINSDKKGRLPKGALLHAHFTGEAWEGMLLINGMTYKDKRDGIHSLLSHLCLDYQRSSKNDLKSGPTGDMI